MPLTKNLPNSLSTNSELVTDISIYKGELTQKNIVSNVAIIKKSFPSLPTGFYDVLIDRLKANEFSDQRLNDAVNHVIDTCIYPTPTIANFISFDKKIKTYTYNQVIDMLDEGDDKAFDHYKPVKFNNLPALVWVHINDIAQYKLTIFEKDN